MLADAVRFYLLARGGVTNTSNSVQFVPRWLGTRDATRYSQDFPKLRLI
jgi:hypothetical protein